MEDELEKQGLSVEVIDLRTLVPPDLDLITESVEKTGRLLAEALGLAPDQFRLTFQSRFGREPWLQPYTDETLKAMAARGVRNVDMVCPGFAVDCLETLEENSVENAAIFREAGGNALCYIPALNSSPGHVAALAALAGWLVTGRALRPVGMMAAAAEQRAGPDIGRIRADFPVLARRIDGHALAYLDNAASSQQIRRANAAMSGARRSAPAASAPNRASK